MRPRPCSPGGYERRSIAHFSVRQRSPFRKSFMPSRRQTRHFGPRSRANYTLLLFRGRTPLCACGVTSFTPMISSPAACSERIAVSRPEPGPLTKTSTFCRPCSMPLRAHASAVTCAANGVDLREPLKPAEPADSHAITFPSPSVRETIVLLKEVLMCAWPIAMFFFTRRRARPLVACRLGGAISGLGRCLLAAADGLLRALAGSGVRLGALPANGQAAPVPDPAVGADLAEALDRLRALAPQVALDLEVAVDVLAELGDLLVGEVLDLLVRREPGVGADLLRGRTADPVDVGQADLEPLLVRKVDSGDARHQPCLCLWRGFVQMTMVRPCRLITRQRSHIALTEARTFIGVGT